MTESPQEPGTALDALYDAIEQVLLHHRLCGLVEAEDENSNFPLVDHLCTPGSADIGGGRHEIRLICDAIYSDEAFRAALATPPQTPTEPPRQHVTLGISDDEIDLIAADGMISAGGGIYSTRVYEFAREVEKAVLARWHATPQPPLVVPREREALQDTERLSWLEENGIAIERDIEGEWRTLQYCRYGHPIRGPERMTLRAAIDAARAAVGAAPNPEAPHD